MKRRCRVRQLQGFRGCTLRSLLIIVLLRCVRVSLWWNATLTPMNDVQKAIQTQLKNIETRSGKSLDELSAMVRRSGLQKHGEIRDMLKRDLGLGHGDANTLTHYALESRGV